MNKKTIPKLIGFNLALAVTDIILLSSGFLDLAHGFIGILIAVASLAAFMGVNYLLMTSRSAKYGFNSKKLEKTDDFIDALSHYRTSDLPFNTEITVALRQLEQLQRKKEALFSVSGEKTGSFETIADEVEAAIHTNVRRMLNRFLIYDKADGAKLPMHKRYLAGLVDNNEKVLNEFDSLIIEVSQLGDIGSTPSLNLDYITESLKNLRTEGDELEDNKFKLTEQGGTAAH